MSDTQWPRFEVFKRDKEGKPHTSIGTVHAPDEEIALLNARNVFVRRPDCENIWVVAADKIFAKTAEELAADPHWHQETIPYDTPSQIYYIFQKHSQRRAMTYVIHIGEIEAVTPVQALAKALDTIADPEAFVWWVCPEAAITRSDPEDIDSMFTPVHSKIYRMPSQYRVVSAIRQAKDKRAKEQSQP